MGGRLCRLHFDTNQVNLSVLKRCSKFSVEHFFVFANKFWQAKVARPWENLVNSNPLTKETHSWNLPNLVENRSKTWANDIKKENRLLYQNNPQIYEYASAKLKCATYNLNLLNQFDILVLKQLLFVSAKFLFKLNNFIVYCN